MQHAELFEQRNVLGPELRENLLGKIRLAPTGQRKCRTGNPAFRDTSRVLQFAIAKLTTEGVSERAQLVPVKCKKAAIQDRDSCSECRSGSDRRKRATEHEDMHERRKLSNCSVEKLGESGIGGERLRVVDDQRERTIDVCKFGRESSAEMLR